MSDQSNGRGHLFQCEGQDPEVIRLKIRVVCAMKISDDKLLGLHFLMRFYLPAGIAQFLQSGIFISPYINDQTSL
jgi:hypothetical protein